MKIKITKDGSGLNVMADSDNVPLALFLDELVKFESKSEKNKVFLSNALENKDVTLYIKPYRHWIPMGGINPKTLSDYKKYLESKSNERSE